MRARIVKRLRDHRGFTLVELVVAMPIMLVVMGGLVLLLTTVMHWGSQDAGEQTTLQTEARSAMNRLETEIRGAFVGQANSVPFTLGTATSMTFDTPDEAAATAPRRWLDSPACRSRTGVSSGTLPNASFRRRRTRIPGR